MNKNIFNTKLSVPLANTVNNAGGVAYALSDEAALAQYCMTGTINNTFYASGQEQLLDILSFARKCSPEFLAKLAIFVRQKGFMKDTPALLMAYLSTVNVPLFKRAFPLVIDNLKMVRNFVTVIRSGTVGRKSLGSAPKKAVQRYLTETPVMKLFRESAGNDPSLADLLKMTHPRPTSDEQKNFFAYILDKEYDKTKIHPEILALEEFRKHGSGMPPNVNFQFLSNVKMSTDQWVSVADNMSWHTLRMNINTLERNGVFKNPENIFKIGARLADEETLKAVKVFPFQIFNTIRNTRIPELQGDMRRALNNSLRNVPELVGKTVVLVDISGSMGAPVMGERNYTATSAPVTCKDAAGLFAAAIKAKNYENTKIIPFQTIVVPEEYIRRVNGVEADVYSMTNEIAKCPAGGTDTSCGINYLYGKNEMVDNIIILSDNESWFNNAGLRPSTAVAWDRYHKKFPNSKLVCVDMTPGATTQVVDTKSVLNIGGFSDSIFTAIDSFLQGLSNDHWVNLINKTKI